MGGSRTVGAGTMRGRDDEGSAMTVRPLAGVRLLDATRMVSGPLACHYLAALGANVVRFEPPGGDPTWTTPPFVGPNGVHAGPRGPDDIGLAPLRRARGKRSVVLDVKHPRAKELFLDLVTWADVLVENFRPGVMDGLGFDRATLMQRNERIIHCSITGYGHDGPYRDRPAMDLVVQAVSGLLAKTGFPDGPPTKSGVMIGDQLPAIFAALAVLAALRARDQDGQGRFVDVTMFESLLNLVWDEPVDRYQDAGLGERFGNRDPRAGPLGVFETRDGAIAMVLTGDDQWECVCDRIERPDLAHHTSATRRGEILDAVNEAVAAWCVTRTTKESLADLDSCGVPCGRVEPPWVGRTDPHVAARGTLEQLGHGALAEPTSFLGPRLPFRIEDVDLTTAPAETLGASTDAVLRDICGVDDKELDALRAEGVIAG
jgi:crotonobetainyl-CoA:carnitine CoA-transferase CaiB-like acyl-CoA transferase